MLNYNVRAAIAALPGKTVKPWGDGDKPCHCTHCDLCGLLFRTLDIATHVNECERALLSVIELGTRVLDSGRMGLCLKNRFCPKKVNSH